MVSYYLIRIIFLESYETGENLPKSMVDCENIFPDLETMQKCPQICSFCADYDFISAKINRNMIHLFLKKKLVLSPVHSILHSCAFFK